VRTKEKKTIFIFYTTDFFFRFLDRKKKSR